MIGPAPELPDVLVAAGHFRRGVSLAPGTGKLLAAWMTGAGGLDGVDAAAVSPARFAARRAG